MEKKVTTVNIAEAKARLPELVRRAGAGEEILIARDHRPVARLVPIRPTDGVRLGCDQGQFVVPDDFDEPLPDDLLDQFS